MDLLVKSPLHSRHLDAGAKLAPFAGWEMPVQYEGIKQEHLAVRRHAGVFDVSHMGEIETVGPDAEVFLQHLLSNDVTAVAERGAQYSVLCREDGGVLDDLFTYRMGEDRFLTVTNAANHEKDLAWFQRQAAGFRVEIVDVASEWAMLAVQGPDARALLTSLCGDELPGRFRTAELGIAGVPCLVCGTGYTGEDGCELLVPPDGAPIVWDALLASAAVPCGLGARDTLRLEVCFHLYGNDLSEDRNPIEAGLGWCCKLDTGFIGAERLAAHAGPGALCLHGSRDPTAGQPDPQRARRGRGHQRQPLALPRGRHRHGVRAAGRLRTGHRDRGRRPRHGAAGRSENQAPLPEGELTVADATYPSDLKYHPEHDWARVDGELATFGITWYAQDAVGEIVFFDPPAVGSRVSKDESYAEIESVKAVSEVIAPLSGEVVEINEAIVEEPEAINADPYGAGWMVKVRLADPAEAEGLLSAADYEGLLNDA